VRAPERPSPGPVLRGRTCRRAWMAASCSADTCTTHKQHASQQLVLRACDTACVAYSCCVLHTAAVSVPALQPGQAHAAAPLQCPRRQSLGAHSPAHQQRHADTASTDETTLAGPCAIMRRCAKPTGFLVAQGWLSGSSTSSRSSRWLALNKIKQSKRTGTQGAGQHPDVGG
jgi:hypothetical protein